MKLHLQALDGVPQAAVARIEGDWRARDYEGAEFVLHRAREGGCTHFIIDISSARYVPDSMMSMFIELLGSFEDAGKEDHVVLIPPRVPGYLGSAIFPTFPDLPQATNWLRR